MAEVSIPKLPHRPVLYQEIIDYLAPHNSGLYLDCTVGAGGHAKGILQASAPSGQLIGLDLDPSALFHSRNALAEFGSRVHLRQGSYLKAAEFVRELGWQGLDGIVADLGVSSMQLDQAKRGFSFRQDAPLDMRFDPYSGKSAADLLNTAKEKELADILWHYGEERFSRRIAKEIIRARPLNTTVELAEIVRRVIGRSHERQDPATRTFQALRIAVNDELNSIKKAIPGLIELLQPKGRLAIISFHSLEDRLVKQAFRQESRDCICSPEQLICTCNHKARIRLLTLRPVLPDTDEININPRARSARLRVAEKL